MVISTTPGPITTRYVASNPTRMHIYSLSKPLTTAHAQTNPKTNITRYQALFTSTLPST
jgi:hypothetical protein